MVGRRGGEGTLDLIRFLTDNLRWYVEYGRYLLIASIGKMQVNAVDRHMFELPKNASEKLLVT